MSWDTHRHDLKPPPPALDEGYWAALLYEGEFATSVQVELNGIQSEDSEEISPDDYQLAPNNISNPDWDVIKNLAEQDKVMDLLVIGYNRGGLLVEWQTLRGFVPASQLINFPASGSNTARHNALMEQIGQNLRVRVIELNPEKNRLIFSERAALAESGKRSLILTSLQPGDKVTGIVTNLCDFGAFVDLGGLEGLIHISELSWGRVGHPSHMLERGEQIEAYVIGVDQDASRVALSIKRLRPDPWKSVDEYYTEGQIVEGVITNVVDFGAFACIEEGLEGLIHISELAEGHFLHPRNVVSEGQQVKARILSINGAARRLGLSLRINS